MMKRTLATLALSTIVLAGPALAAYSPSSPSLEQTGVVPGSVAELNLLLDMPATAEKIAPQKLALASGCDDFWYSASGWQWIAELIVDRC